MFETNAVHSFLSHHPQDNFATDGKIRIQHETVFSDLFAESYRSKFKTIHSTKHSHNVVFVRELPIHGNGIADLVSLSFSGESLNTTQEDNQHPTLRAFEIKLTDWRKGLMQAYRYKYFSDAAIVVLPTKKLTTPKKHIELFKKLGVGLWGFNPETGIITSIYTPRPTQSQKSKYYMLALKKIQITTQKAN